MIQEIDISLIDPNPYQVRESEDTLASARDLGVLDSILRVRPSPKTPGRFELVFGHRRLRTMKALGKERVYCEVVDLDNETILRMLFLENEDRKDLNDFERGALFRRYLDEFKISQRELEKRLGVDHTTINLCLQIAEAGKAVVVGTTKADSFQNIMTTNKFKETTRLGDEGLRVKALTEIVENDMSTDETKSFVSKIQEGKVPVQAANEIILQREHRKASNYSERKGGVTRTMCVACKKTVKYKHEGGRHVVVGE